MNPALKYDVAKAAAIQPAEAVRLLQPRQGEEGIWLQTFADAPSDFTAPSSAPRRTAASTP